MTYQPDDCAWCGTAVHIENGIATEHHGESCPKWARIPRSWNIANVEKWSLELHDDMFGALYDVERGPAAYNKEKDDEHE